MEILSKLKNYHSHHKIKLSQQLYIILFSLFNMVVYGRPFLFYLNKVGAGVLSIASLFLGFFLLFILFFSLILHGRALKPLSVFILLCNSLCLYYMNTYRIQIDVSMLLNVLGTDSREICEMINAGLIWYIILFGIAPSLFIVLCLSIEEKKRYSHNLKLFLTATLILIFEFLVIIIAFSRTASFLMNNRRDFVSQVIPANYLGNIARLAGMKVKKIISSKKDKVVINDTIKFNYKPKNNKKNLLVIIVGESARSQNFSLNGYGRNTNEFLEGYDLLSFRNFYSCATTTGTSIFCMFSPLSRENLSLAEGNKYPSLLDILNSLDFDIRWRSNNTSCKGACQPFMYVSVRGLDPNGYDEALTKSFRREIRKITKHNNVIVLNQLGSHMLYQKRYPKEFRKFTLECEKNYDSCSLEELINAYDNSIYYSSYNIRNIIDILKEHPEYNSALIYVSDHGEAFGEDGLWNHSMPYDIASDYVKKIPMLLWFSDGFREEFNINVDCLKNMLNDRLSHDNLFHSILGLFHIESKYYDKDLDMFGRCEGEKGE